MSASYKTLFTLWEKSSPRRDTTVEDYQKILYAFADFVQKKALTDIVRRDIIDFRDYLLDSGQSARTASHKVGILKTLFRTAINYEMIASNPAEHVRTPVNHDRKRRIAFSSDDLKRIFHSPIYTCAYRSVSGGGDACYWLPLLALFTGARIEELAQLLIHDLHSAQGLGYYLNISDEAEHSKLKNPASRRRIPLHHELLACGFLDYVDSVKAQPFLFPRLKPNPRNKRGGYFSTFFSGYLRRTVRISDKRKVFHSLRHTFKDTCRAVGIEESVHDALTGHTNASAGRKYGNDQYPLRPLFDAMNRFEIEGLDLSHLRTEAAGNQPRHRENRMISAFYGLVIAFPVIKSMREIDPYVLVLHQNEEAGIDVANNQLLFGRLPAPKLLLAQAWVEIHREELLACWYTGRRTGEYFRIDPLR